MEKTFQVCVSCTVIPQGLAPARKKKLILVHITTQGRTQWRTPPRFDPSFLLYFHLIVRLTATGLSISPSSKSKRHSDLEEGLIEQAPVVIQYLIQA